MKKTYTAVYLCVYISLIVHIHISAQSVLNIAAASDLKFALDSIISVYSKTNQNTKITVSYGSSGNFFEQISNGAPFDLFFSADIDYPQKLEENHFAISKTQAYGIGQIVIWSKKTDPKKEKMNCLLNSNINTISIANPNHAPYGKRAQESMVYYNVFQKIKDKLVFGENVSQAAQFITSGAADIGIIALSLALSPNMKNRGGYYYIIPEESYSQLIQGFVILKHANGNNQAKTFSEFILSDIAKNILAYYGFK